LGGFALTSPQQIDARLAAAGGRTDGPFWLVVFKPVIWCSSSADSAVSAFLASRAIVHDSARTVTSATSTASVQGESPAGLPFPSDAAARASSTAPTWQPGGSGLPNSGPPSAG